MDTGETTDAKAAAPRPPVTPEEPPYEGELGRTCLETVHVTIPGGFVRSVQVYTGVNVATDPQLRDAATTGALHRFEGGEELAIPFVFHDPAARKLALVLPETLRHRELPERARLLERLSQDTRHAIPPYVREARVVIGMEELASYLESVTGAAADAMRELEADVERRERETGAREADVQQRERETVVLEAELEQRRADLEKQVERLVEREKRLHARAEDVTRREDEVRLHQEELERARGELAAREQELARGLEGLKQREGELGERQAQVPPRPSSSPPPRPGSIPPPTPSGVTDVSDDDVEEIEDIEPVETDAGVELADAVEMLDEEERDRISASDVEELVDDDDVEEIEDIDAVREVTGVEAAPEPRTDENEVQEAKTQVAQSGELAGLEVTPPTRFLEDREIQMVATHASGGVWLFVRLTEGREDAFRDDDTDLLVQLSVVQGYAVVMLALVEHKGDRPYVRYAAINPQEPEGRRVLDALRKDFSATAALFGPDGSFERTIEVSAPSRRVNVAMVVERVDRMRESPEIDAGTALERALAVPPPVRETGLPFRAEEPPPSDNALEATEALAELERWSTPERIDQALLQLSVPRDVVEGSMRRILEDAVEHGVALPPRLLSRAVSVGVAPEPGELVSRQITRFREVSESPDRGGLSEEQIADNWDRLLQAAAEQEVAIDGDTHELAWRAIRAVRGDSSGPAVGDVETEKLPEMGAPELVLLLDHPRARREAALELCRRSDPELLDQLFKAVRKMPRAEVVRVVPRIVEFGEVAGDVLIDGLSARKTFVRQASALGLGHLKLRRAVVPLVHLLQNEPSEVWREVARVLGELGTASLRALSRSLKDKKSEPERLAWALAHLANHGGEKQVQKLASDADSRVAGVAEKALTLREDARKHGEAVRASGDAGVEDPGMQFSQRFYAEMSGTAPDADLADSDG